MNAWGDFTQQVGVVNVSADCGIKDLQTIFIAANVEEDKTSAESKVNFARALHRFEFLECIIRVAIAAYHTEKSTESICSAIDRIVEEHLRGRYNERVRGSFVACERGVRVFVTPRGCACRTKRRTTATSSDGSGCTRRRSTCCCDHA